MSKTSCRNGHPYPENRRTRPGGSVFCVQCRRDRAREWKDRNPERVRDYGRRYTRDHADRLNETRNARKFGLTSEQYAEGLLCDICGEQCSTGRRLAVDHDHTTGSVRGRLCASCNRGLGLFRDRPDLLLAAARYLDLHTSRETV
jgi:hypothetical protein